MRPSNLGPMRGHVTVVPLYYVATYAHRPTWNRLLQISGRWPLQPTSCEWKTVRPHTLPRCYGYIQLRCVTQRPLLTCRKSTMSIYNQNLPFLEVFDFSANLLRYHPWDVPCMGLLQSRWNAAVMRWRIINKWKLQQFEPHLGISATLSEISHV